MSVDYNRKKRRYVFEQLFMCEFYPKEETSAQLLLLNQDADLLHEMESDELSEEERTALQNRAAEISNLRTELDERINQVATGWKTHRMGRAELAIIRQALYEMAYDEEIPYRVAINEAVELAKQFGGEDSPAFVNAVLGKLVTQLGLSDA